MEKKSPKTKCPYCKSEISFDDKNCPNCGKILKGAKIIVGILMGFFALIIAIAFIVPAGNSYIAKINSATDANREEATEIYNILKESGLEEFSQIDADTSLNHLDGENTKGYRIKTSFSENVILYLDGNNKVVSLRYSDKDFYKDGKVLLNFNDYKITFDEKNEYNIDAKNKIKSILKSPSTAKFPNINNWKFGKENGEIILQAYVDSQNSFGATVRAEFQIIYSKDKIVTSLIFDGVEYIK